MSAILLAAMLAQAGSNYVPRCDEEKAEQGIQQEMNICAAEEFTRADYALNEQWQLTSAELKLRDENYESTWDERPGYFDTLLAAQRAWLTYRDAHCSSEGYYARGGSLEPLLVSSCKTKLTEERTQQLAFLIEQ